jgi:hypothetical protein
MDKFRLAARIVSTRSTTKSGGRVKAGPFPAGKRFRLDGGDRQRYATKRGKHTYLVAADIIAAARQKVKSAQMIRAVDEYGHPFVVMAFDSGDSWSASIREGIDRFPDSWVTSRPDRATCSFHVEAAESDDLVDPDWDSLPSLDELVEAAFRGRTIEQANDPRLEE